MNAASQRICRIDTKYKKRECERYGMTPDMIKDEEGPADDGACGSGLCYSLALFLAHQAHFKYVLAEVELLAAEGALQFEGSKSSDPANVRRTIERLAATRWFSTAALPLRSLQIPRQLPGTLRQRLHHLKDRVQKWMFPWGRQSPTLADVHWAVDEAKELVRLIDEVHGVQTARERMSLAREPILRFRGE